MILQNRFLHLFVNQSEFRLGYGHDKPIILDFLFHFLGLLVPRKAIQTSVAWRLVALTKGRHDYFLMQLWGNWGQAIVEKENLVSPLQ